MNILIAVPFFLFFFLGWYLIAPESLKRALKEDSAEQKIRGNAVRKLSILLMFSFVAYLIYYLKTGR